jgi:anti-sigma B factor antagonist
VIPAEQPEPPFAGDTDRSLTVAVEQQGEALIFAVTGEFDSFTAPRVQQAVAACLADRPRVLVFDLTAVTFMSSAGLGVVLRTHEMIAPDDTEVRVVAADRRTRDLFRITGADGLLDIYPSRADALDSE